MDQFSINAYVLALNVNDLGFVSGCIMLTFPLAGAMLCSPPVAIKSVNDDVCLSDGCNRVIWECK